MGVRSYRLLTASRRSALQARLDTLLASWLADWCKIQPVRSVGIVAGDEWRPATGAAMNWCSRSLESGCLFWHNISSGFRAHLEEAIFGAPVQGGGAVPLHVSVLAAEVTEKAMADLLWRIDALFPLHGSRPHPLADNSIGSPEGCLAPGAGAVMTTVLLADNALDLLLPPQAVDALLGEPPGPPSVGLPALYALDMACDSVTTRVAAYVGSTEIVLGDLQLLSTGDVIRLPTHLDEAISLWVEGRIHVGQARIGVADGQLAIELEKSAN